MSPVLPASTALLMALVACGGGATTGPDSVAPPLSERVVTEHIIFHHAPGDAVDPPRQEALHDWVVLRLDVRPPKKLQYFKYQSRAHMSELIGRACCFAETETLEIHSIYPFHAHEAVHVYSALLGRPTDFFNEGLAVALSVDPLAGRFYGTYSGEPVHAWARGNRPSLRPLESMATTEAFRALSESLAYQEAGSFVEFLVDTEGFEPMRELFRRGARDDGLEQVRAHFQQSFGFTLSEAERRWLAFLASEPG